MAELTVVYDTANKTFLRATIDGRPLPALWRLSLSNHTLSAWDRQGRELFPAAPSTSAPTAPPSTIAPTPRATASDGDGDPFLDAAGTLKAVEDVVSFFASPAQADPSEDRA